MFRKSCKEKTDDDLPRYGKTWRSVPNIPATQTVAEGRRETFVYQEIILQNTDGDEAKEVNQVD